MRNAIEGYQEAVAADMVANQKANFGKAKLVTAVMTRESWTEYVQRITAGVPRKEVAKAAQVNISGISRWLSGETRPSAEKVVSFARGLRQSPIEALIAAGYLEPHEAAGVIEVVRSLSEVPDEELLAQIAERMAQRPSGPKVDDITSRLARPDNSSQGGQNGA